MKTEKEILDKVLEYESKNKQLQELNNAIESQVEINEEEIHTTIVNSRKIKRNNAAIRVLRWVIG